MAVYGPVRHQNNIIWTEAYNIIWTEASVIDNLLHMCTLKKYIILYVFIFPI
jgi:hypothetical protein